MDKQFYTKVLSDLAEAIKKTNSKIYIFAGFTIDIWEKEILRDHHDIDTICLELFNQTNEIVKFFENKGYEIIYVPNGDLKIKKNGFGISMTNCEIIENTARWSPYGVTGSIYFPSEWLADKPCQFNNFSLYTVDKRFEYCLKINPSYFNPDWEPRDHSKSLNYLKKYLSDENISVESFIQKMYPK